MCHSPELLLLTLGLEKGMAVLILGHAVLAERISCVRLNTDMEKRIWVVMICQSCVQLLTAMAHMPSTTRLATSAQSRGSGSESCGRC